jgi:hypothetical protein
VAEGVEECPDLFMDTADCYWALGRADVAFKYYHALQVTTCC